MSSVSSKIALGKACAPPKEATAAPTDNAKTERLNRIGAVGLTAELTLERLNVSFTLFFMVRRAPLDDEISLNVVNN